MAMTLRVKKRKQDEEKNLQSEFSSYFSPFSDEITTQLFSRCILFEDLPMRSAEGAGRNKHLCSRKSMTELTTVEKHTLAGNIQRKFVDEKIKMGSCATVKLNNQTIFRKNSNTTFADIHRASEIQPLIVCCCSNLKTILQMPQMIPLENTATDVISFGATYSTMHVDIGGTHRDQHIVNDGSCKIHIIATARSTKLAQTMKENIESWTDESGALDCSAEITWILDNPHHFKFLFQRPFEQIQHCGANYHSVLTLVSEKQGITLSVGFRSSAVESTSSFFKSGPDKSFMKSGCLVPAKNKRDEQVRACTLTT